MRAKLLSYSPDALRGCVAALERWEAWASRYVEKKAEFLPANPILVGTFLSAVARGSPLTLLQGARRNAGGPTAAAGVKAGPKLATLGALSLGRSNCTRPGCGARGAPAISSICASKRV